MPVPVKISKADARRMLVRHHFAPAATVADVFERLRSVQFDPIAPVGCNHDLVLQARVPGYKIGDWEDITYKERLVYDGWDKQASLVPFEGWPLRRVFGLWYEERFEKIRREHPQAVEAIFKELEERGPLMPKDFGFQEKRSEWEGSWYGPSVTKQALRAMWHAGHVMTAGRTKGQHLYDLTERVVPSHLYSQPKLSEEDSVRNLILERHRAVGLIRPSASPEMWSYAMMGAVKNKALAELLARGDLVPVEVEEVKVHATPDFLAKHLDQPSLEPRVVFVAPLDQLLWDRKFVGQVFNFDYVWEIYTPEAKRRWGYYVLPVLYGDDLVARAEFWCRSGTLEMRRWHFEDKPLTASFYEALDKGLRELMHYCSATEMVVDATVDSTIRTLAESIKL